MGDTNNPHGYEVKHTDLNGIIFDIAAHGWVGSQMNPGIGRQRCASQPAAAAGEVRRAPRPGQGEDRRNSCERGRRGRRVTHHGARFRRGRAALGGRRRSTSPPRPATFRISPWAAASARRLPAVPAGLPGSDDAAFSRAWPCLYPCRHPTQQDRRPVEAAALAVVRGSVARGTIERRPEKFGRDQSVLRRQVEIRRPGRREHSWPIPGSTRERSQQRCAGHLPAPLRGRTRNMSAAGARVA